MNGKVGWFVAGTLSALIIGAMLPSIGWFVDSFNEPSEEQVDRIAERQLVVLQTLPTIQQQLVSMQRQIDAIVETLRVHMERESP